MTDARFPERWLNDRRVTRLSDGAFRLFVTSLAWSAANRTDGIIERQDVELIPRFEPSLAAELHGAGLWQVAEQGWYVIVVYEETQTTATELAHLAEQRRQQSAKRAERRARQAEHEPDSTVTPDVRPDVRPDSTRTGQARPGQASVPATQLERTTQREEELRTHAHTREDLPTVPVDDSRVCAEPGCELPARRACVTCWPHARAELDYRDTG